MRRTGLALIGLLVVTALAAGCGGDDEDDDDAPGTVAAATAAVSVRDVPGLGSVVATTDGLTLYYFTTDSGGKSACTASCAETWPPAVAPNEVGKSAEGVVGEFGSISRDDGSKQLTLGGRPLYRYVGDKAAGEAKGEGIGGVWFAAKAGGAAPAGVTPIAGGPGSDSGY